MGLLSSLGSDIGLDLGTANTCVFAGGAIALNEPSLVAFNTERGMIEAVGREVWEMVDRANITPIRPMKNGVIADYEAAETMLTHFVRKARGVRPLSRPRMVVGVPTGMTPVERRALEDSTVRVSSELHLVDEAIAAAIGAGMPIWEPTGNMIVDVGGGTTDITVISMANVVYGRSLPVAGDELDAAIVEYLVRKHHVLVEDRTAERIKCEIGSAAPLAESLSMEVAGRGMPAGGPRTITVTDHEIREALARPVRIIVKAVCDALQEVPPELCADIYDRGLILTGGGALLHNLHQRLRDETGLPVLIPENPFASVALGAGMLLSNRDLLGKVAIA